MHVTNQYIGMRFKNRGRTKEGVDCWGLVRLIYSEQYNIQLPSYEYEYCSSYDIKETTDAIEQHSKEWIEIEKGQEQEGDLIIMRLSGYPTHVGVVIEKNKMLHIVANTDAIIENYTTRIWQHRIVRFLRHKEHI